MRAVLTVLTIGRMKAGKGGEGGVRADSKKEMADVAARPRIQWLFNLGANQGPTD